MYEPFSTSYGFGQNRGLGLALVYSFTRRSSGFIECDSEVGDGTEFKLFLPHIEEENVQLEADRNTSNNKPVILIIDDEPILVAMAAEILEQQDYKILQAHNSKQALNYLMDEPVIDLVFCDERLGGRISSFALAEKLTQRHPEARFLFCRALSDLDPSLDQNSFPGLHTISKPYTNEVLINKIRDILTKN